MKNRKIEFRGKRIDTGEWVKGDLCRNMSGVLSIMPKCFFSTVIFTDDEETKFDRQKDGLANGGWFDVIPETVGQNTGLPDCLGNITFENDKLIDADDDSTENGEYYLIVWDEKQARFRLDYYGYAMYRNEGGGEEYHNEISLIDEDSNEMSCVSLFKVIGNTIDNPELLKQ